MLPNLFKNCFFENGNVNIIGVIYQFLINPKYLTNFSLLIVLFFIIIKNDYMIDSLMPLILSNGIFITIYMVFYFKSCGGFDSSELCSNALPEQKSKIDVFINNNTLLIHILNIVIHFWLPFLFYLKIIKIKQNSNPFTSLLITIIALLIWVINADFGTYKHIGLDEKKFKKCIVYYLIIHVVITILYFKIRLNTV